MDTTTGDTSRVAPGAPEVKPWRESPVQADAIITDDHAPGSCMAGQGLSEEAQRAQEIDPLPVGRDLLEHWKANVGRAERQILCALEMHQALDKEALAEAAGYTADGGGFNNALSRLRTLELITRGARIALSEDLR